MYAFPVVETPLKAEVFDHAVLRQPIHHPPRFLLQFLEKVLYQNERRAGVSVMDGNMIVMQAHPLS